LIGGLVAGSLIRGRYIVKECNDRNRPEIIGDGAILEIDGKIAEVGSFADLSNR
jgi:hypothetical protein